MTYPLIVTALLSVWFFCVEFFAGGLRYDRAFIVWLLAVSWAAVLEAVL